MKATGLVLLVVATSLPLASCEDFCGHDECTFTDSEWKVIQTLSPLPEPPLDPTNAYDGNPAAITLGQKLFFEKRYSNALRVASTLGAVGDKGKVSCTSCHDPEGGFSDTRSNPNNMSLGVSWTTRNAPSLVNTVYYVNHGWDLRQDTLWNQGTTTPETGTNSAGDRCEYSRMLWTLYRDEYNAIFPDALPATLDPMNATPLPLACRPKANAMAADGPWEMMAAADKTIINRIMSNQGKAVSAFEAKLISRNAPFDRYVAGDLSAITEQAKQGLKVFLTKGACVDCHSGPFFNDQKAHNLGIPQIGPNVPTTDQGLHGGIGQLMANTFNSAGTYSDNRDVGMERLAALMPAQESDRGKFRTQTLRNLPQSAPYMHTGAFTTIRAAIAYYNEGGGTAGFVGTKDVRIRPLQLTTKNIDDLAVFLETLVGEPIPSELRTAPTLPPNPPPPPPAP